jgi:hypothetical protein
MEEEKVDNITLLPDPSMTADDLLDKMDNKENENLISTDTLIKSEDEKELIKNDINEIINKPILDENSTNPLNQYSEKQIAEIMKKIQDLMSIMESQWDIARKEFKLKEVHMRKLFDFNESNKLPLPEMDDEKKLAEWTEKNKFSGLDKLTQNDIKEIFGNYHPISELIHTIAISTIKDVYRDFISWVSVVQDYRKYMTHIWS